VFSHAGLGKHHQLHGIGRLSCGMPQPSYQSIDEGQGKDQWMLSVGGGLFQFQLFAARL